NCPVDVLLSGPLNVAALSRALRETVGRHEILRTTYRPTEGVPVPRVAAEWMGSLRASDLRQGDSHARDELLERAISAESRRPFDLRNEPPLRAILFRVDEHHHHMLLVLHHIAADIGSVGVFVRDLACYSESAVTGN